MGAEIILLLSSGMKPQFILNFLFLKSKIFAKLVDIYNLLGLYHKYYIFRSVKTWFIRTSTCSAGKRWD